MRLLFLLPGLSTKALATVEGEEVRMSASPEAPPPLCVLQLAAGQKADFHAPLHGGGDAAQHGQGMAIIVRVFKPGDDGLGGPTLRASSSCESLGLMRSS